MKHHGPEAGFGRSKRGALALFAGLLAFGSVDALALDLDALRRERTAAVARRDELAREQASLEPAFAAIGQSISARKRSGAVTADASLEALLQRHREVSERLTHLTRELRASAVAVLRATQSLVDGIDREVASLTPTARGTSGPALVARAAIKALLAERSRFAVGPVGGGCALPEVELSPSDGPDEARAKLNLLRDAEERCRRRILKVEGRLTRLRDERRLLQEAADFRDDTELFDEESRRRVQVRASLPEKAADRGGTRTETPASPTAGAGATSNPAPAMGTGTVGDSATGFTGPTAEPPPTPIVVRQAQVDSSLGVGTRGDGPEEEIAELARRKSELLRAADRIRAAHELLLKRARGLDR